MVGAKLEVFFILKSSGRGNRLGFAPSSQSRALCALHKLARSVRYPDSLRSIRTSAPLVDETKLSLTREGPLQRKIRFWCQKLHKNATPLIVTAVLNSTRAALTRATRSNRRPLDAVSLSTACSNLRMGCICCYYEINNCAVLQGCKGALAPLHKKKLAKQT